MLRSDVYRKLSLALAAAGFFAVAGCSNQPATEASNQASGQPAKPSAAPVVKKAAPAPKAGPKVVPVSAKATQPQVITLPKGTPITATVGQTLASDKSHPGDSFAASLAAPVSLDGKVVLPKGTHVTGRVVTVKKHELKVALASVVVRGKSYDLATNSVRPPDKNQGKSNSSGKAATQSKSGDKNEKKDVTTLSAKTRLTFKLAKPVTFPAKG